MLLYLTDNEKVNLLDFVESSTGLIPKKMTGKFSLMQFVIRDMRNYSHIKYLAIDRTAISEDDNGFVEAIRAFQTMFDARLIVIADGCSEQDAFLRHLIMAGVTNIVISVEIGLMQSEILECLSPDGMARYKAQEPEKASSFTEANIVQNREQLVFSAKNVRIAVAGCQHRVGTTTTAMNLAHWILSHGGTACYLESNPNNHLAYILKLYGSKPNGNHNTIGTMDYYFTNELDKNYNFIITDCGELTAPPQTSFTGADVRLLCGSAMPYELGVFKKAVEACNGFDIKTVGICVLEDLRSLCCDSIHSDMLFAKSSHDLMDVHANTHINHTILNDYIANRIGEC